MHATQMLVMVAAQPVADESAGMLNLTSHTALVMKAQSYIAMREVKRDEIIVYSYKDNGIIYKHTCMFRVETTNASNEC